MRASKPIENQHRGIGVVSSREEVFAGYEQRLTRWGCHECVFFEEKVFKSGLAHEELDAYMICRFSGGPVDLIGEATSCPKDCPPLPSKNKSKSGRAKLHCVRRTR
jgi:hypothetical protein